MLLMYNYVLLKMSTWYSKHVEESNNIWRINNIQCITLVVFQLAVLKVTKGGPFMFNLKIYIIKQLCRMRKCKLQENLKLLLHKFWQEKNMHRIEENTDSRKAKSKFHWIYLSAYECADIISWSVTTRVTLDSPALNSVIALRYAYSCSSTCSLAMPFTYSCNLQIWSVTCNIHRSATRNSTYSTQYWHGIMTHYIGAATANNMFSAVHILQGCDC